MDSCLDLQHKQQEKTTAKNMKMPTIKLVIKRIFPYLDKKSYTSILQPSVLDGGPLLMSVNK